MKTIQSLSTPELWQLQTRYEAPPQSLEASVMLRGIRAELAERPRSGVDNKVEELEELLEEEQEATAKAESEAERLGDKLADFEQEALDQEQELRAEVARLKAELAAVKGA